MSESVLEILLKLFAIIAREDGLTAEERDVVRRFLEENLAASEVHPYLERFEAMAASDVRLDVAAEAKRAAESLSRKQQWVLLLHLYELVLADETVSEGEQVLLAMVESALSLERDWISELRLFATSKLGAELRGEDLLLAGQVKPDGYQDKWMDLDVQGHLAVLSLENGLLYLVKYMGDSYLQINHHYFAPFRNLVLRHGSVISLPHGQTCYFSDLSRHFLPISESEKVHFQVQNLGYKFPKGNIGLHALDLDEQSGRLVAVMGASGSGKSTLLNLLNGNIKPSSGSVSLNGLNLHLHLADLKGLIGYVPQDDLLMEDLTVYQNLYFNAKLCHRDLDEEGLNHLVMRVLSDLGLTETKDLRVGNPLEKTISGGQRKRLNIGLELLRAPAVIFFDEPTSGLSSRDSENIMDLLKELTFQGKLIFVVIHQPSSEIFKMFDSLLVLDTGGYPVYYGNPVEAVVYFRRQSEQASQQSAACGECGNVNPEQIFNILEAKVIDEFGNLTDKRRFSPQEWNARYLRERSLESDAEWEHQIPKGILRKPSWARQFGVFFKRDLMSKIGNKQYLAINLLQAPLLALILSVLVRHADGVEEYVFGKNENIPAFFFMSIVVALFVGMTMSAEEIFRDRKILKRESFLSLSRSGYLLAKTGILFGFMALQMACYVAVSAWVLELPGLYLGTWLILFALGCFAILLGLNISATFNSAVTIYILIPLMLIPQLILSGTVVRFDRLNPGFSSPKVVPIAADLMASRWAYEALMVHHFRDNAYESRLFKLQAQVSDATYFKDYWVPELTSIANFVSRNHDQATADSLKTLVEAKKQVLTKELDRHADVIPTLAMPCIDSLEKGLYSESIHACVLQYLETAKSAHLQSMALARTELDAALAELEADGSPGHAQQLALLHHNEAIDKIVRNTDSGTRLMERNGTLIRTFEPIYHFVRNPELLSYRTHFFSPDKPFAGLRWDTIAFNLGVVVLMSLVLCVTLYTEAFRKLLSLGSRKAA
jgi:ABC-type multidrug transport system ATPase subunit